MFCLSTQIRYNILPDKNYNSVILPDFYDNIKKEVPLS